MCVQQDKRFCPLVSSARLTTCGTAWGRFCRPRGTRPQPPSASSRPWSWRPAAPSCPSPSFPERYERRWTTHFLIHTQHVCMPHEPHTHRTHSYPRCRCVAVTPLLVCDRLFASTLFCTLRVFARVCEAATVHICVSGCAPRNDTHL